ncbi:hypothetical protein NDU88_005972 [Pleurodeles waltl]|uniref:Uncharacterized protein n=1 Tax=Pleurodeles waltl TaxID=8319 RepID=A0AAV7UK83_PLEWA|nr:hypothetical protein NDU88_005972 [Pleurodeles waltl]
MVASSWSEHSRVSVHTALHPSHGRVWNQPRSPRTSASGGLGRAPATGRARFTPGSRQGKVQSRTTGGRARQYAAPASPAPSAGRPHRPNCRPLRLPGVGEAATRQAAPEPLRSPEHPRHYWGSP